MIDLPSSVIFSLQPLMFSFCKDGGRQRDRYTTLCLCNPVQAMFKDSRLKINYYIKYVRYWYQCNINNSRWKIKTKYIQLKLVNVQSFSFGTLITYITTLVDTMNEILLKVAKSNKKGSILWLVWSPWCLKMSFCDQTFVIGCQIGEQVKKLPEMLFLCHLVSRFELSRVHDKVKDKISLFTVNLVHYFKRRSDFVLNRDHFHNNWMIHRFKCANDCRNIKTWLNETAFLEVLLYLVHNVSGQFSVQNTIKCDVSFKHQHSWDPDSLVVKAPVLRNLIQVTQ
jgi:hypothetical protein